MTMAKILHTIGYEGASIESLLAALKRSKIALLIDVRDLPLSPQTWFLEKLSVSASQGIAYQLSARHRLSVAIGQHRSHALGACLQELL